MKFSKLLAALLMAIPVKPDGLSMRVARNNAADIDVLVSAPGRNARAFTLLAKLHGMPCSGAQGTVRDQKLVRLPANLFPVQGIVELTLADEDGRPVAERLVFVNPQQRLTITAEPDQERYGLREQIRGNIFNPTYYFDERNADRLQALDLLLLTQGWRHYVWDNE